MKNLKLFVAPLLGATLLLTACGPKSMDVKDFRAKVEEKFNLDTIRTNYKGKKQHITGTVFGPVEETHEIEEVVPVVLDGDIYIFKYKNSEVVARAWPYDILSAEVVDDIEKTKSSELTLSYSISGDTYTIEEKGSSEGASGSMKIVFKDLVITHFESKASTQGMSMEMKLDFKYE